MKISRSIRTIIIIAFCLGIRARAVAQLPDYHLQLFDNLTGIRAGNIVAVTRDTKGFLWVLYPRSIQRFDGRSTKQYRVQGEMRHLFCDNRGRLWAGSARSIYRFDEEARTFVEAKFGGLDTTAAMGPVFNIGNDKTWVLTTEGFFEYNEGNDKFERTAAGLPLPPRYNYRTLSATGKTIYFSRGRSIFRYNAASNRLDSLPDRTVMRIYAVNADSALVTSWNAHTYWYNFREMRISEAAPPAHQRTKKPGTAFSVRAVCHTSANQLLIPSSEGLYEYNTVSRSYRKLQLFHKGNAITTADYANYIYNDGEGYIWLSTVDGIGRFPLHGQSFGLIRLRQLQPDLPVGVDNIRYLTEDKKGNLWLATGAGFVLWERTRNRWKFFFAEEGSKTKLGFPSVRGITYDGKYIILGPTAEGIRLYDPRSGSYRLPRYTSPEVKKRSDGDFFDAIATLNNGHHLFMGRDALYVLNGTTYQLDFLINPAASENTNWASQGKNGLIWMTTMKGLHLLDSNLNYLQRVPLPGSNPFISAAYIMPDDSYLFAMDQGMFIARYLNGKVEIEKFTNLFDDIFINAICQDHLGYLWATSENGIYRLDVKNQKLSLFDFSDNVQGYGFNGNSWHRSHDSVLFIGGLNGLNYIQPEKLTRPSTPLRVYIEEARSWENDSVLFALNEKAILPYSQRSIEIDFASPYFNNPEKVKYRYRLLGFDREWNYTGGNNSVCFTSLPPGDYSVEVQASINNADWIPASNSFNFEIQPPFWLTWWFVTLSLVLFGALIFFAIRNRNKKIRQKNEELETEQAINYFSSSMYRHQSVDDILWDVARNCIGRLHFEDCVIYILDERRNMLVQKAAYGPKNPERFEIASPIEIPVRTGITGTVAATGRAEIIHDTSKEPRYIVDDKRRYSEITVPIIVDGRVLGVIDCEHSKKRFFTQRHLSILTTIASLCASKLVKAKAETEKQEAERILMDTRQKMAEAEMQALRAQMNPHFIFNCLNSINRYIVKSDQATASLYLTRFAKLIRLILDNSNSKTVTLSNELEALRLYIEMESIRFEKQFTYNIKVDESVQADSVYVPPLIMQPYVENAIWHGLLHKQEAGHLSVTISRTAGSLLQCVIADNGVGREKAKELKSKSTATKKSLGMKLTEDRLTLLNQQANLDASVQVIDVRTEDGHVAGTTVILKIPIDA